MGSPKADLIGKRVHGDLYVHRSATGQLSDAHCARIVRAQQIAGDVPWNVAKLSLRSDTDVSLLVYDDFDGTAFPALHESHRLDLDAGSVATRRYTQDNPPILHRKELMLSRDDPRYPVFAALTANLEERGLFVDMSRRGRKRAWNDALTAAGVHVRDHRVVDANLSPDDAKKIEIARHRTAIGRSTLSAPMAALNQAGMLTDTTTILDYGCGRGDDLRALQAAGFDAVGWDPHFAPDRSVLAPRDIVNLGFVLNVVDDIAERQSVLRAAFDLAETCLAVAVMLVGKGDVSGLRPHKDGFLTSRGTFQKYFTQAEIRNFVLQTLDVMPVAAGPGVFFVFKTEEAEQEHLSRQTAPRSPRAIPAQPRPATNATTSGARSAALEAVRGDLVGELLAAGRTPHTSELPDPVRTALSNARLSVQAALADVSRTIDQDIMAAAEARRRDEVTRFFALNAFSGRASYRRLAPSLRRDVRAFFGSLGAAEAEGRRMLFEAGDAEALAGEALEHAKTGIGRLIADKYQFHARDLDRLGSRLQTYIGIGTVLAGALDDTTIFQVHIASRKLSALSYPDFATSAIPRLSTRTRIDFRTGDVAVVDHTKDGRVQILTGKSCFMPGDAPSYAAQKTFDAALAEAAGGDLEHLSFAEIARILMDAKISIPPE